MAIQGRFGGHGALLARVGRRIEALRIARGISRRDLATKSGATERAVASAEQGVTCTLTLAYQLAHALGVTLNDLVEER